MMEKKSDANQEKPEKKVKEVSETKFQKTCDEAEAILNASKGKRGFQKGNKLSTKAVREYVQDKSITESRIDVYRDPAATVLEVLARRGINAANEMVKAARLITDPAKRFSAFLDLQKFIEGQRRTVDIKVNKTEEKNITIVYQPVDSNKTIDTFDIKPVATKIKEEILDAEYKTKEIVKQQTDNGDGQET